MKKEANEGEPTFIGQVGSLHLLRSNWGKIEKQWSMLRQFSFDDTLCIGLLCYSLPALTSLSKKKKVKVSEGLQTKTLPVRLVFWSLLPHSRNHGRGWRPLPFALQAMELINNHPLAAGHVSEVQQVLSLHYQAPASFSCPPSMFPSMKTTTAVPRFKCKSQMQSLLYSSLPWSTLATILEPMLVFALLVW